MSDMNQCNFTGRLGKDPDSRYTGSGKHVVNFSIACSRKIKGEEQAEWIPLVAWEKTADIAAEYLRKGSQVRVTGRFQTRSWEHNGEKRYKSEIVVTELQMMGSRAEQQEKPANAVPQNQGGNFDDFDQDIPF